MGENVGCARDQKGVSVGMLVQHRYDSREYEECTHVHSSSMIWGCIVGGKSFLEVFLSKKAWSMYVVAWKCGETFLISSSEMWFHTYIGTDSRDWAIWYPL